MLKNRKKKEVKKECRPIIIFDPECPLTVSQKRILKDNKMYDKFKRVTLGTKEADVILEKMKVKKEKFEGNPTFLTPDYELQDTGLKGHGALQNWVKKSKKRSRKKPNE